MFFEILNATSHFLPFYLLEVGQKRETEKLTLEDACIDHVGLGGLGASNWRVCVANL